MSLPLPAFVSDLREDIILAMAQHEVAIVEAGEARRLFEATKGPTDPEAKRLIRVCNRLDDVIRRTRVN